MKTVFDRMPISGGLKNPLNVLKAYLKRPSISKECRKTFPVSIFPSFILLSCLVCCKCLIYTFSDIRTLLFVFFMASEIKRETFLQKTFARREKIKIQRQLRKNFNIFWRRRNCSRSYLFTLRKLFNR